MNWKCPCCSAVDNDESSLRCSCGYELGDKSISKVQWVQPAIKSQPQELSSLKSEQKSRFVFFMIGTLILGFIVIVAADTYARITIANDSISHAVSECLRYLLVQPIGTILLLFPFLIISLIAAKFSKEGKTQRGLCILIGGFLPAIYRYFAGYIGIQHALQKGAWTAAALSNGFMPFLSLPFIAVGLFVGFIVSGLFDRGRFTL